MLRITRWWCCSLPVCLLLLASIADAQEPTRATPSHVYTNDDFPSGNSAPPSTSAILSGESSAAATRTVKAETPNGWSVNLAPDGATDLLFMATSCRHSKALLQMLEDSRAQPYWAGKKLIFVFSKNEGGHSQRQPQEASTRESIPVSDIPSTLGDMKREAGSANVTDPAFLKGLPGPYYLCTPPREVTKYPTVLSVSGYANSRDWLTRNLQMPEELYEALLTQYDSGASRRVSQWGYGGYPHHTTRPPQQPTSNSNTGVKPVPVAGPGPANSGKKNPSKQRTN